MDHNENLVTKVSASNTTFMTEDVVRKSLKSINCKYTIKGQRRIISET